jgi:hypothetical protein
MLDAAFFVSGFSRRSAAGGAIPNQDQKHFHHRGHRDHREKPFFTSVISVPSVVSRSFTAQGLHRQRRFYGRGCHKERGRACIPGAASEFQVAWASNRVAA